MSIYEAPVKTLHGAPASLGDHEGEALLIVNVASKCGYTPQYTHLEELQQRYAGRGFTVIGFPCNQFGAREPGTAGEIDWNFEKFVVSPHGDVVARFRSKVTPDAPEVVAAIEAQLPPESRRRSTDAQDAHLRADRDVDRQHRHRHERVRRLRALH